MQETHTFIATIGAVDNGDVFSGATFDAALAKYLAEGWVIEPGNFFYTGEVKSNEGYVLGQRVLAILTRYTDAPKQRKSKVVEEAVPA